MIDQIHVCKIDDSHWNEWYDTMFPNYYLGSNIQDRDGKDLFIYVPICGVDGMPRVNIDTVEGKLTVDFTDCQVDIENPFARTSPIEIELPSITLDYSDATKAIEKGTLIVRIPYTKKSTKRVITL